LKKVRDAVCRVAQFSFVMHAAEEQDPRSSPLGRMHQPLASPPRNFVIDLIGSFTHALAARAEVYLARLSIISPIT
jgi:hypothetical protein